MKNGLWSAKRGGEGRGGKEADGEMSQYSAFSEKENPIVQSEKDDDFVAVIFL